MNMDNYKQVIDRITINDRCREEVLHMGRNPKTMKRRINKKAFIGIIAAAVVTVGCTVGVAADRLGVFDRLGTKQQQADKYDKTNYQLIGQHAQEESVTSDTESLCVNVESVYCDGSNLVLGLTGSLSDGNTACVEHISFCCDITVDGTTYVWNSTDDDYAKLDGSMVLDEGETNSFIGRITLTFQEDAAIKEPAVAEIRLYDISIDEDPAEENSREEILLSVEVTPKPELVQEYYESMSQDGFEAVVYEISPAMVVVGSKYPEFYDTCTETIAWNEGEQILTGPKYAVVPLWYDANGQELEGLDMSFPDYGDGFQTVCFAPTDAMDSITVKWFNQQCQNENGNMELLYEYTFDLSQ